MCVCTCVHAYDSVPLKVRGQFMRVGFILPITYVIEHVFTIWTTVFTHQTISQMKVGIVNTID